MTDAVFSITAFSAFYGKIPNAVATFDGKNVTPYSDITVSSTAVVSMQSNIATTDGDFNIQATAALWPKTQNANISFVGEQLSAGQADLTITGVGTGSFVGSSAAIIDTAFDISSFALVAPQFTGANIIFTGESTASGDISITAIGTINANGNAVGPINITFDILTQSAIAAIGASTQKATFGISASASIGLANGYTAPVPVQTASESQGGGGGWKYRQKRKKRQQQQDEELIAIINMAIPQILAMIDANEIENFHN